MTEIVTKQDKPIDYYKGISVNNDTDAEFVVSLINENKATAKELEAAKKSKLDDLRSAIKKISDDYKPALDQLSESKDILNAKLTEYQVAKQKRIDLENAKAADKQAAVISKAQDKADKLSGQGKYDQASQVISQAYSAPAPINAATKVKGLSTRKVWSAKVKDSVAFTLWIAGENQGLGLDQTISFKKSGLNALAKLYQDKREIPGLTITCNENAVVRK